MFKTQNPLDLKFPSTVVLICLRCDQEILFQVPLPVLEIPSGDSRRSVGGRLENLEYLRTGGTSR